MVVVCMGGGTCGAAVRVGSSACGTVVHVGSGACAVVSMAYVAVRGKQLPQMVYEISERFHQISPLISHEYHYFVVCAD